MPNNEDPQRDLKIFQTLQQSQWQLWIDIQVAVPQDFSDSLEQFRREEDYRERLRESETLIASEFDVSHQYLNEIMIKGIFEGWIWREA